MVRHVQETDKENQNEQEHVIYRPLLRDYTETGHDGKPTHEQALSIWQGPCVILPSQPLSQNTRPGRVISSHTALRAAPRARPKGSG